MKIPEKAQKGVLKPQRANREEPMIGPVVRPKPAPVSRYPIIFTTSWGYMELIIESVVAYIIPVDRPRVTLQKRNA